MKTCIDCGEEKPESDFYERKKGSGKFQAHCKKCSGLRAKKWVSENRERFNEYQNQYRKTKPGERKRRAEAQARYRERQESDPDARWRVVRQKPHDLYRIFDAEGTLLYVGITYMFDRRMTQHSVRQPWWGEVDRITSENYPDRSAAEAAEWDAISQEKPKYNIRKTQIL